MECYSLCHLPELNNNQDNEQPPHVLINGVHERHGRKQNAKDANGGDILAGKADSLKQQAISHPDGLKLHGYAVQGSAAQLEKSGFAEFALYHNLPIIFHSGRDIHSLPEHVLTLAQRFPQLRLNMAHFALFDNSILERLSQYPNIFVDSSPLLYLSDMAKEGSKWVTEPNYISVDSPALTLLEYYMRHKSQFMWGTDEPWTKMITPDGITRSNHSYQEEVAALEALHHIMPTAVRDIAQDNTLRFLFG